jgi:ribosome-associated protein
MLKPTMLVNPTDLDNSTHKLVQLIASSAEDRKAADLVILKVNQISYLTDYFMIMTGFSRTQVKAIAEAIEEKVAQDLGKTPLRVEGKSEALWVVQDYGDVIVHIFLPEEREFYNLEAFWGHAERLELEMISAE